MERASLRNTMLAAVAIAVTVIAGSEEQQAPLGPTPIGAADQAASAAELSSTPGVLSAPAASTSVEEMPDLAPRPPGWDVLQILDDGIGYAGSPHHSGIGFSISPSQVTAGQEFTVTARVPSGVSDTSRSDAADSGDALIPYLDGAREVRSVTRHPSGGFRLLTGRGGSAIRSGGVTRVRLTPESRREVVARLTAARPDFAAVASGAAEDERQQMIRERERRG